MIGFRRFVIALLSLLVAVSAARASAVEEAETLVQQGRVDEALRLLGEQLDKTPGDRKLRSTYGWYLNWDGQPDKAVATWRAGLTNEATDVRLWWNIGKLRARQAKDGATVTHRRGMVSYSPSRDKAKEAATVKRWYGEAIEAYEKALELGTDDAKGDIRMSLAEMYQKLNRRADARNVWERLVERSPDEPRFLVGLAAMQEGDERVKTLGRVIKVAPTHAEAHFKLAEHYRAAGDAEKAEHHRKRSAFYEWMPPFARTRYTDAHYETFMQLHLEDGGLFGAEGPPRRIPVIESLLKQDDAAATELLAAVCYHHTDHGDVENRIFAELEKRGADEVLIALIHNAQSTCTARSAAHALARRKSPKAFDLLVRMLPNDRRPTWHMDVAGALATLGDERAVEHLIRELAPDQKITADKSADQSSAWGYLVARHRATVALSAFGTPAATDALRRGVNNPQLKTTCLAGLYRQSPSPKTWKPLAKALDAELAEGKFPLEARQCLQRVDTPEARAYVKKLDEAMKKAFEN